MYNGALNLYPTLVWSDPSTTFPSQYVPKKQNKQQQLSIDQINTK